MTDVPRNPPARDTRWADGLRGIASVFVVCSHLARGYAPELARPRASDHDPIRFYNLPFIRVFAEGQPWVAVFLLLTGFVNALKPIQQARSGHSDAALGGLASSTFRRTSRLMLPCTVATVISWAIAQMGGYNIARMLDSGWLNWTSPSRSAGVWAAVNDLASALHNTWSTADNKYDRNQWTMQWFLKGSFALFVVLLATVRALPKYRMMIFSALFLYSWAASDTLIGVPIYVGALLAEASYTSHVLDFAASKRPLPRFLPYAMAIAGWYFMSYPQLKPELMNWSNTLWHLGLKMFPAGGEIYSLYSALGVMLLTSAILLSHPLQRVFSHPALLWLGQHSFPIYLIHGPLLRSFLNWILCVGMEPHYVPEMDADGDLVREKPVLDMPPPWRFAYALPIFFAVLLLLSAGWMRVVEPRCASFTVWLENRVTGKKSPTELPVLKVDGQRQEGKGMV